MEIIFAYIAGLLTLINPCVLPVLPIVLATALNANRLGPVALAAGLSVTFVAFGVFVSAFGFALGIGPEEISKAGAVIMILFGVILVVPKFGAVFSSLTQGFANRADQKIGGTDTGSLRGQFVTGLLLGAVWSPCVGPTLGGAIALASQGEALLWVTLIMLGFAAGVSTLILALGYGARSAIQKRQAMLRGFAEKSKTILGVVFLGVGLMIFFNIHQMIEGWFLQILPAWLIDLSVRF
ncbi:MAG: cytochrome c biogenesis CcdA family protein [Halocynthiibacter sp.]